MSRFTSIIVAVVLLMGSVSPIVAQQRVPDGSPGEVCPMMGHQLSSVPCIGEPCPCHHGGSDGSLLPDGVKLSVPEQATSLPAPVTETSQPPAPLATFAAGFSTPIDHPPQFRA